VCGAGRGDADPQVCYTGFRAAAGLINPNSSHEFSFNGARRNSRAIYTRKAGKAPAALLTCSSTR